MIKKSFVPFFITIVAAFVIVSCEKEEVDTEIVTAQDYTIAEQNFIHVFTTVHSIGIQENGLIKSITINNTCADFEFVGDTFDFPNNGPVSVIIDYGVTGCNDLDGRLKKGKLKATFNDKWSKVGSKTNIEFDEYFVNDIKLDGSMTIIYKGDNSYDISVVNGKCIASLLTIAYSSSLFIHQPEGANTKTVISDDVFEISGTGKGNSRDGKLYTSKIVLPLINKSSCSWMERGVSEITPEGLEKRTVNYGNGECDENAIISINGSIYHFNLK